MTLPFAPRWQTHLGAAYTIRSASLRFTPRIDASYQSKTFFDATNTPEIAYARPREYFGTVTFTF